MSYWKIVIKGKLRMWKEAFIIWLAWRLPRRLIYWCAIRVAAEGSVENPQTAMPELTAMDALHSWDPN